MKHFLDTLCLSAPMLSLSTARRPLCLPPRHHSSMPSKRRTPIALWNELHRNPILSGNQSNSKERIATEDYHAASLPNYCAATGG